LTFASFTSTGSAATVATPIPTPARVRLVLVDDHAILREGLRALLALESDLEVVGEAENGDDGLRVVERLQPDVVITDLAMPHRTGIHVISKVRKVAPAARVLVLTVHNGEEYIKAALTAGADGYVLKDSSRADLLQGIRTVVKGQRYLCAPVSAKIVSGYLGDGDPRLVASIQQLTDREREILTLIALGKSNKRIALQLNLSVKTIEKHRSNFMRKLELHNTAGVTMFAICNGLVSADQVALHADPELLASFGADASKPVI
jgi:DNA-binding NarL/FixJ family response regulator